jgi:hypothetical protein
MGSPGWGAATPTPLSRRRAMRRSITSAKAGLSARTFSPTVCSLTESYASIRLASSIAASRTSANDFLIATFSAHIASRNGSSQSSTVRLTPQLFKGLQSGAAIAPMVCRQFLEHRELTGDAPARG